MENNAITVSELTREIAALLEEGLGIVTVTGEISNFKHHSSGHRYFTLKDENSQISCVMWRGRALSFQPDNGMKVIVTGSVEVYPARGNYQIDCLTMTPLGIGELYLAFEALKKKLSEAGYFETERKRRLPSLPLKVGVATSPTGAVIKDILTTIERRFDALTVYFRPTLVQGDGAAEDIARAIAQLNSTDAEVLIVGRGGGSLEDLWPFNMEITADAIFHSRLPVISAVGHETDFTIADFTADMRAATPTAAAELVTPYMKTELYDSLDTDYETMKKLILRRIRQYQELLDASSGESSSRNLRKLLNQHRTNLIDIQLSNKKTILALLKNAGQKLQYLEAHSKTLHPMAPLSRGFAALRSQGQLIPKDRSLASYKQFDIVRELETAVATVKKILPNNMF